MPERLRLHDALIELCFERGFAEIEVEDLCSRADVSPSDFYGLYDDLEDCFVQTHAAEHARYQSQVDSACEGLTSWRERLRGTAYAMYRFIAADEKVWKFTFVEVRAAGERAQLLIGAQIERLVDLLDEGRQELADPSLLTRATAESVAGSIFNQIYAAAGRGGPLPPESEIVPQLMYAAVLPYLGNDAAQEELSIPPSRVSD